MEKIFFEAIDHRTLVDITGRLTEVMDEYRYARDVNKFYIDSYKLNGNLVFNIYYKQRYAVQPSTVIQFVAGTGGVSFSEVINCTNAA